MNWKKKVINLGTIPVGKKQTIIFESTSPLDIKTILTSCGCTIPKYDKGKKQLTITYTPGTVPIHLRHQGLYSSRKTITIYYKTGETEVLSFNAKITN